MPFPNKRSPPHPQEQEQGGWARQHDPVEEAPGQSLLHVRCFPVEPPYQLEGSRSSLPVWSHEPSELSTPKTWRASSTRPLHAHLNAREVLCALHCSGPKEVQRFSRSFFTVAQQCTSTFACRGALPTTTAPPTRGARRLKGLLPQEFSPRRRMVPTQELAGSIQKAGERVPRERDFLGKCVARGPSFDHRQCQEP